MGGLPAPRYNRVGAAKVQHNLQRGPTTVLTRREMGLLRLLAASIALRLTVEMVTSLLLVVHFADGEIVSDGLVVVQRELKVRITVKWLVAVVEEAVTMEVREVEWALGDLESLEVEGALTLAVLQC